MNNVLLTGSTGFVGSRLYQRVAAIGGHPRRALRRACSHDGVVVGDLAPETDWSAALVGIDCVLHLAARVPMMNDAAGDPLAEFRWANVAGSLNLARQAVSAGVRRFVYVSTIKVNGESTVQGRPFRADDEPAPVDAYGISKWEAEQELLALANDSGMEVTIVRPPLVYGPGVKGNFAAIMTWVSKGMPLPLGAVRNNRRSLVALDNLVDLIVTCIDHPAAANQVFLVGDNEDLSTSDLLCRMARAMNKPARLVPVPVWLLEWTATVLGKREVAQRLCGSLQVDISKTRELLGWMPPVSVDEGLERAVAQLVQGRFDSE